MDRLQRLDYLAARLKSDGPLVVAVIAEEVGVSIRTLSRDIQILRERGLPIEADRGRGGGVRLRSSWGIGRVNLDHAEAVDLLMSLAVAEKMKSPLLMANLSSVRRKVMASFSPSVKLRINKLKSRILIGESASPFVLSFFSVPKPAVVEPLHQAFLSMHEIAINYRSESQARTVRTIEPHYLLLRSGR